MNQQEAAVAALISLVAAAAAARYLWNARGNQPPTSSTIKPLHVSYRHPVLPLIVRLLAKLPPHNVAIRRWQPSSRDSMSRYFMLLEMLLLKL